MDKNIINHEENDYNREDIRILKANSNYKFVSTCIEKIINTIKKFVYKHMDQ